MGHSLSPSPLSSTMERNVDWGSWAAEGLFAEFVPQLYTSSFAGFSAALSDTRAGLPSAAYEQLSIGIRIDGTGSSTAWLEAEQMLDTTAAEGLGAIIWYANGMMNTYPTEFEQKWGEQSAARARLVV